MNQPIPHQLMMFLKLTSVHPLKLKSELHQSHDESQIKVSKIDPIHAEMLNVDIHTLAKILTDLFTTIGTKNTIPADSTKGLTFNPPKEGDLQNCDS